VPAASKPPVKVAESYTELPAVMALEERVVEIVGVTFETVKGSQPLVAGLLLVSPLYDPWKL